MEVKKLTEEELEDYDNLVDNSYEGTVFHKSWWLKLFQNIADIDYNVEFFGCYENKELVAGFPISYTKKYGKKIAKAPPLLTPYMGSFYINKKLEKIVREITWKKEINTKFAEILASFGSCFYSFSPWINDIQPFIWKFGKGYVGYTYILKLNNLDQIWKNMDRKRRNDINKCYKQNYQITFEEIDKFIEINMKTFKRQKVTLMPSVFWEKVYQECKKHNSCEIFTGYIENISLASLFLVWDNKRSYYLGGGINENSHGAMSLLMWEAIKYTKEKLNLNEFDFEGSSDPDIEFYFRKFGGEIKPWYYIIKKPPIIVILSEIKRLLRGR